MILARHPGGLVAGAAAGAWGRIGVEGGGKAGRTIRGPTRRVALPWLCLRPIEFCIEIPMEAFLSRRVQLHRAPRAEDMIGAAAAEAAAEIRGMVGDESSRGRVLVACLDGLVG